MSEDEDKDMTCGSCGHTIGARCTTCGRGMVCGSLATPCPQAGCREGVLADPEHDLTDGPLEDPRPVSVPDQERCGVVKGDAVAVRQDAHWSRIRAVAHFTDGWMG